MDNSYRKYFDKITLQFHSIENADVSKIKHLQNFFNFGGFFFENEFWEGIKGRWVGPSDEPSATNRDLLRRRQLALLWPGVFRNTSRADANVEEGYR